MTAICFTTRAIINVETLRGRLAIWREPFWLL
jgi:hypothetical protein